MPWPEQRAVIDFMEQAEDIPLSVAEGDIPADLRPTVRANVDAGTDVIDLGAMRAELEAARRT